MRCVASVGVVGASGYSGGVLTSLVLGHPDLELAFATSDKAVGESVTDRLGLPRTARDVKFVAHEAAIGLARVVDIVVLASSAEHATRLAPELAKASRVVDLSGAFRLDADAAFYGLPELFGAVPKTARIVANPGCYATAALLATAPFFRAKLATGDRVVIDGKSGISGAGRRADEAYSFVELAEDLRAYKVGAHPHTPEITRHLHLHAKGPRPRVTFTPHLVPLRRGLLVTAVMSARDGVTSEAARATLDDAYGKSPLVRVVSVEQATAHAASGTALAFVGATVTDGAIVSVCTIDNLMKGAASQAIQNINAMLGLPETAGLEGWARF